MIIHHSHCFIPSVFIMEFCFLVTIPIHSHPFSFIFYPPYYLCILILFSFFSHPHFPPLLSIIVTTPPPIPLPGTLPYDIKIVIAGNHELTFDQEFMADLIKQDFYYFPSASKLKPENYENVQSLLTNCIYLQDSEVTVRGFRIYGSPWWVSLSLS